MNPIIGTQMYAWFQYAQRLGTILDQRLPEAMAEG